MWIDSFLFWAVLVWMLLLGVLAFFSVRALLKDDSPGDASPTQGRPPASDNASTTSTSPPGP